MLRSFSWDLPAFPAARSRVLFLSLALVAGFAVGSPAQVQVHGPAGKAFVYKTVAGRQLSLYVQTPAHPSPTPYPAIIYFHGGGWEKGGPGSFNHQGRSLAARGMVVIEVEYRLITGHESPQICVEDAKSSIRWVREHAGELNIAPHKIVESGGSAGGYLAAFASMVPGWDDPQDNLNISPKADLLVLYNPVIDNGPAGYGYNRLGPDYKRYSPFFYVTPATPPTLILSGEDDKLIRASVLEQYKARLEQAGVPCELIIYKGAAHGFFNREPYLTETTQAVTQFLEEQGYLQEPSH